MIPLRPIRYSPFNNKTPPSIKATLAEIQKKVGIIKATRRDCARSAREKFGPFWPILRGKRFKIGHFKAPKLTKNLHFWKKKSCNNKSHFRRFGQNPGFWTLKVPFLTNIHIYLHLPSLRNHQNSFRDLSFQILFSWDENLYESFFEPEKHAEHSKKFQREREILWKRSQTYFDEYFGGIFKNLGRLEA